MVGAEEELVVLVTFITVDLFNCENQGGTCVYLFFFWHSNVSIAERNSFLALEQTTTIFQ